MRFANPSKKTRVLSTLKGLHIEFPGRVAVDAKGKPLPVGKAPDGTPIAYAPSEGALVSKDGLVFVHVPPSVQQDCIAANLEPETSFEEPDEATLPKKPESPIELEKELFAAFGMLVEAARREDFAGSGMPKADAIEKITGYAVTNAEIKDFWQKYQQAGKD